MLCCTTILISLHHLFKINAFYTCINSNRGGAKGKNAWYTLFVYAFNFRDISENGYFRNSPCNSDANFNFRVLAPDHSIYIVQVHKLWPNIHICECLNISSVRRVGAKRNA